MSIHATSTEVYSGKNLYDQTTPQSGTWGITYSGNVNFFEVNGNPTGTGGRAFIGTSTLPAGTYTLTLEYLSGEGNINVYGYVGTSWTQPFPSRLDVNSSTRVATKTFTLESQTNVRLAVYTYSGNSCTNLRGRFQIEAGSTSTSFEPYVGGVPSPLISDVSHVSTSKNLLNMQSDSNGEYFGTMSQHGITWKNLYIGSPFFSDYGNIGSWEDGGTYNGMPVIKRAGSWTGAFKLVDVIAGKTYTFSTWIKSDQARPVAIYATGGSTGATAAITPGSDPFTSSTSWERHSFTFTCNTSGTVALRVENRDSSETNYTYISGYQLELGSEATSYERYIGDGIYSGKNLYLPIGKDTPNRGLTLTYAPETGECSVTGTSTSTWSDLTDAQSCDLPAGTYTFSVSNPALANVGFIMRLSLEGGTHQDINLGWGTSGQPSKNITVSSKITSLRFWMSLNQGITVDWTGKLQVEEGSTATTFEPYVGGVPSPNPDYPQEIATGKLASKNLFALGKTNGTTSGVSYTYNSDGTFNLSGTANAGLSVKSAPIPISESGLISGEKYSFWCDHNVGWGSNSCVYYVQSCDSSGTWIANLMTFTSNSTATMPSTTAQYVTFVAAGNNGSSYSNYNNVKAQLVAGEQVDNAFEPYFTPIELAQIGTKQDKVYKSGNSWYVYRELGDYQLTGSENWQKHQASGAFYDRGNSYASHGGLVPVNNDTLPNIMSTHFVEGAYNEVFVSPAKDGICVATDNTSNPRIHVEGITTVEDFKTMITTKQPLIYFPLATPTDTAITDSATIAWLNKYDTDSLPHHKYVNTRRTTYVGASGLASAIDLYDGSYASTLPTYADANDHHLATANGGTYTVSLQNISAKIVSGTVTFSVFTNQRKIDFSWNGSATSTSVSVSLQADEYIKSIYAYIPQNADAGITLSQQLESGSLTDFEPYYNIVKIYAGDDLVFEDTSLTD